MHIVTPKVSMRILGAVLEAGVPYFMNSTGAGSLLTNRHLVIGPDGNGRPVYRLVEVRQARENLLDWEKEYDRIFFFRGGGFGDCVMLTTLIQLAKQRWPAARLRVVTMGEYGPVFEGHCDWTAGFLREDQVALNDGCVFFEGVIEDNPRAQEVPGPEMFVRHAFGGGCPVPLAELPNPFYEVSEIEKRVAQATFPASAQMRVGVQPLASAACRTYPPQFTFRLIERLMGAGYQVLIFGKPGTIDTSELEGENLLNLSERGLSFRESCAMLATCSCVVVPDSALQHVCAALKIPTVSLWGAFPWHLRVPYGVPGKRFQPLAKCSPCFHHETGTQKFPKGQACEIAGFCTVMAQTNPDTVFRAVDQLTIETL